MQLNATCGITTKDITDPSSPCFLTQTEDGHRDTIAMTRMIGSVLSIIGTTAIVTSVVTRRQCCNTKVTPIFVLCIADLLLALTWLVGSSLWLRSVDSSLSWCFMTSLLNIILECVAMYLTLTYAIVAHMKATQTLSVADPSCRTRLCSSWKTFLLYFIAWFLPLVLVLVPFGWMAEDMGFVADADDCTCWCLPTYGNVVPYVIPRTNETAKYIRNFGQFRLYAGLLLGTSYLLVFVLLVSIYCKILRNIRKAREPSGTTEYRAERRVIYFIVVFVVCGFANFVLSYAFVVYDVLEIRRGGIKQNLNLSTLPLTLLLLESLSVPLQGFLNAVVYGWTHESFVRTLVNGRRSFNYFEAQREYEGGLHKSNFKPEFNSDNIEPEWNSDNIEPEQVSVKV